MSKEESETGIASSEGVVVFCEGDDVDKVVKGTKKLIIHESVKKVSEGDENEWICPFPGYETIEELIIEEGVEVIGKWAFYGCENLKRISFPSSLEEIGEEAFNGCSSLIVVNLSHTNVTSIGKKAFIGCKTLKSISFPSSLEEIGGRAFSDCSSLIEVGLSHTNVTKIGKWAFYECENLKRISFPSSLEEIGECAFSWCSSLTEVDLSHTNVTSIGKEDFYGCENLKKISFPTSLEEIGGSAFVRCYGLIEVDLSHTNLTSIGKKAFIGCKTLKSISFPSSLEEIGEEAFCWCSSLTEVDLSHTKVTSIGYRAFDGCDKLNIISFPTSLEEIGGSAFVRCYGLIEVDLSHTNLTSIGKKAFDECKNLKSINFPTSLKEIRGEAFCMCCGLTEVDLSHTNVTSIGKLAFRGCEKLKRISFPTSLKEIGEEAFCMCCGLTEVDLSHTNVTSIGKLAFRGCENLKKISFPSSLEEIGDYVFYGCKNLPKESIIEIEKVYKRIYERSKQEHDEDHDDTQQLKANLIEFQKEHGHYLNEDTEKNLRNLQGFIKSRDNINKIAKKVLPNDYMKNHPSFKPQQTLRQSKNNLADIMEDAKAVKSKFEELLRKVAEQSCLSPDEDATFNGEPVMLTKDKPYTQLTMAPLKSNERCEEKSRNEYGGDISRLIDIVRASFVVENEPQLIGVADTLKKLHDKRKIEMVRLKNRFNEPLWNGYRDALYNIKVNDVICEVQLHLGAVVQHKKESHHYYEHFRSYFAGNVDACIDLIKMLETSIDKDETNMFDMLQGLLKSEDKKVLQDMRALFQKMGDIYLEQQFCRSLVKIDPGDLNLKIDLADAIFKEDVDSDEAEKVYDEAYEEAKEKHGDDHVITLRAMHGKGKVEASHFCGDKKLLRECFEKRKAVLGENHRDTLDTMHELAVADEDDIDDELLKECYEKKKEALGESDPSTLETMSWYGRYLFDEEEEYDEAAEEYEEAESILQKCWELQKKSLGENHTDTLYSLFYLADVLDKQEKYDEALPLWKDCKERMNITNHIYADCPKEGLNDCLTMKTFKECDKDGDGFISASELRDAMKEKHGEDFTDEQIAEMIGKIDRNKDGKISSYEFYKGRERLEELIEGFKKSSLSSKEEE